MNVCQVLDLPHELGPGGLHKGSEGHMLCIQDGALGHEAAFSSARLTGSILPCSCWGMS